MFLYKKIQNFVYSFVKIFIFVFLIWFVLSPSLEKYNIYLAIGVGFLSSLFFHVLPQDFMSSNIFDFLFKKDFYKYAVFMAKEAIVSAYAVIKAILLGKKYESNIVIMNIPENISIGKTLLLTSSITLTPGTSVILIQDGKMYVHCLLKEGLSITDGNFVNKVLSFKF